LGFRWPPPTASSGQLYRSFGEDESYDPFREEKKRAPTRVDDYRTFSDCAENDVVGLHGESRSERRAETATR